MSWVRVESRGYGLCVAGAGFDVARGEKIGREIQVRVRGNWVKDW